MIEQFLPAFHYGDAIGNSTLRLHHFLRDRGIDSRIIALTVDDGLEDQAIRFSDYRPDPRSTKILHFAIPSLLTDFFLQVPGPRVLIYHNITPSDFFVDFSPALAAFTHTGRQHLRRLNRAFDLVLADSTYNARELEALGFAGVSVFPIMIDLDAYRQSCSQEYYRLLKDERINLVFVGRITPNKKIEDLVRTVFFYKKYLDPSVRLIIAGNTRTLPGYYHALEGLASRFHLTSDDIFFTGHIPFSELLAVYRLADVFISLSEHEGFCLPLIESCLFEVPVIAYRAGAVAETLEDAGLVITRKDPARTAVLAEKVLADGGLQRDLGKRARRRIDRYKTQSDPGLLLQKIQQAKTGVR